MELKSDSLEPSRDAGEELDEDFWKDWEDCSVRRDYPITGNGRNHDVCREERTKVVDGALEIGGHRFHLNRRHNGRLRLT